MTKIHSYSEVYALGHKALENLITGSDYLVIEEKIDGSQYSFGVIDGEICARSKGKEQSESSGVDDLFKTAWEVVKLLAPSLRPNWVYRCEFLAKPKHNVLCYSRTPKDGLIIYDIDKGEQNYLSVEDKSTEAARIGIECVPCIANKPDPDLEQFKEWLERESCLGGVKVEGVVIKNYRQFGRDKKVLMGKYVSEAFKEKHNKEWKVGNPNGKDVIQLLGQELKSEARWQKAIQHLTEKGLLLNEPKDIGLLIQEVPADILKEEEDYIKDKLFKWAWPQIKRMTTAGLPEWYKTKLAESQFAEVE
jgi:hypothetical protein